MPLTERQIEECGRLRAAINARMGILCEARDTLDDLLGHASITDEGTGQRWIDAETASAREAGGGIVEDMDARRN